jgi:hypothetical protein
MARIDTSLLIDTSYTRYSTLRNINFSFSLKLDSSYKFNGFTSGIKYAIINKRDETVSNSFVEMVLLDPSAKELQQLNSLMGSYLSTILAKSGLEEEKKVSAELTAFRKGEKSFDELGKPLQNDIIQVLKNSPGTADLLRTLTLNKKYNFHTTAAELYEKFRKEYNNKPLWTIGLNDTTYKNQFMFSNIVINSEFLKGMSHTTAKNEIELNIKTAWQFTDDPLTKGRDLKRSVFSFEPAVNIVLKTKNTGKSFFELKFSGSYYHNFNGLNTGEKNDRITLNSTIRVRIIKDVWIPVEIKYDPAKGNVFGVLNVKANFTALNGIAKYLRS